MIRNEMITAALSYFCKSVMKPLYVILNNGHFPKLWRDGIIVPVYKHGSHLDASNFRGITLNSCLGKLFCHIIDNRISSELERRIFLNPEQTGFRKNHRTSDHVHVLNSKHVKSVEIFTRITHVVAELHVSLAHYLYTLVLLC